MRTVLIGSDFIYNSNGNLIPIEINTNVGFDNENSRVEDADNSFNLSSLLQFITDNGFTKIEYIKDDYFLPCESTAVVVDDASFLNSIKFNILSTILI